MSRTLNSTVTSAIAKDVTTPVYLIQMGWSTTLYAATWSTDIVWNGQTWSASGLEVTQLDETGGVLEMPVGDSDNWLALILSEIPRNRSISIYEHHTDTTVSPQTDAVLIFTGLMDEVEIGDKIRMRLIESLTAKVFPPTSINPPTYNYLLQAGQRLIWADLIITAE